MNAFIIKSWFKKQFVQPVLKRLNFLKLCLLALLLFNNAPSEDLTYNTKDVQITVLYFPPNTISVLQPMDQVPIEATKHLYRNELITALKEINNSPSSTASKGWTSWMLLRCLQRPGVRCRLKPSRSPGRRQVFGARLQSQLKMMINKMKIQLQTSGTSLASYLARS